MTNESDNVPAVQRESASPARAGRRGWKLKLPGWLSRAGSETPHEKHRREARLHLFGPLGALVGLVAGGIAYGSLGISSVVLMPITALAGFGIMYTATRLESLVRTVGLGGEGRTVAAAGIAVDAVGGGVLGGMVGQLVGIDFGIALATGASLLGIASWSRRLFGGGWIDDTVWLLAGDARGAEAPDYSDEQELIAGGRFEEAIELFEERSRERGGHPGPLVDAAQMVRARGRFDYAIELYAKAMDAPGVDARRAAIFARQILDICRRDLGSVERAVVHLETLVERFPDAPETEWAWKELTVGMSVSAAEQDELGALSSHVPAVKAVEKILSEAFVAQASDIHLEDYAHGLRVRYRVDGMLQDAESPPRRIRAAVLARIRVMAGLNPAESPTPQDARIRVPFAGRDVDIRVSTVPTLHGESIALRILDTERGRLDLEDLGLRDEDLRALRKVASRPDGMILTTGPGGSGKSTTLHSIVRRISSGREKIFTVEDPVEYGIDGVCQVSVNKKAGLDFANLLRSLVRQDPDVLLVGEIRDTETAEIATHASLTGHLVLSTLHTTDAVSALHRLVDIGVPDYMVVHTLEAAIAQRLVRRVCAYCAEEVPIDPADARALGLNGGPSGAVVGQGCDRCRGTGYRGRIGIFEMLRISEGLREAFLARSSRAELTAIAKASGMLTLREDGLEKVRDGITTPEEVLRVTTAG